MGTHATPEITMKIYTHLSELRKQDSIEKMREYTGKFSKGSKKVQTAEKPSKSGH